MKKCYVHLVLGQNKEHAYVPGLEKFSARLKLNLDKSFDVDKSSFEYCKRLPTNIQYILDKSNVLKFEQINERAGTLDNF